MGTDAELDFRGSRAEILDEPRVVVHDLAIHAMGDLSQPVHHGPPAGFG